VIARNQSDCEESEGRLREIQSRDCEGEDIKEGYCQIECLIIAMIVCLVRGVLSNLSAISGSP
jgi:hypothetical protein